MIFLRLIPLILVTALAACSVQFQQVALVKQLLPKDEVTPEEAAWDMQWNGSDYRLYAGRLSDEEILFAYDKRLYLFFKNWSLTKVIGLLPDVGEVRIEQQGDELSYYVNDDLIARHHCEAWLRLQNPNGSITYWQSCLGGEKYTNEVEVNSKGVITRLHFLVHPEYPMLTMSPKKQDI